LGIRCPGIASTILLVLTAIAPLPCQAAGIIATVTDEAGRPLPDAVVTVVASGKTSIAPSPRLASAEIDQRDETFVPMVVTIQRGGSVIFRNGDRTRHHVYSFSPIHPFEFVQKPDEATPPIVFDIAGVAAIGCNIHDNMVAYVYVTEAPRAAVTDAQGRAEVADLPAGTFVATVWHPRLRPKAPPPTQQVTLASSSTTLAVTISVLPPRRPRRDTGGY
jgi:plastocyanin